MRVYSDGITKVIKGSFPKRFKLLADGVEVPYLRTSDNSIRISGDVPFGFLDVQEFEPKKKEVKKPKQFDAMNLAVINKSDFDRVDDLSERLALSQQQMNTHLAELSGQEELLKSLETQNAQAIEDTKANMVEMAKVFGKEIQADRDSLKKATDSLSSSLQENGAILSSKIEAHEKAINPHKITKATIGLERVDNTSDEDKPVSKKTQKALDKKADKSEVIELAKKIESTGKQQDKFAKSLDRINWVGGVGGNELPTGGKEGQFLAKGSDKTGDYKWVTPDQSIEIIRVDELPETGETNILYLVPVDDPETNNIYDEYIWAVQSDDTYDWEKIGSTEIDLSGYVPTSRTINNKALTEDITLTASDVGALPDSTTIGDATLTIQKNGNTIDTFTANATSNKTVNVTVPTQPSDIGAATSAQGALADTAVQPATLNNYVTLNTLQTLTSGKKIFANDAVMAGNQTALLATISNSSTYTTDNAWVGRYVCGAKNLTFLMGTYRTMAGIGAHSWTNAQSGSGASWADFYLNPDGDKAVFIGGNLWTKNSGWLKVKNSGNTNGTVQVNRGSISSTSWKNVACWGDNISNFNNNSGYITNSALSDYVTLNTSQTMTAAKAIFGDDVAFGTDTSQKNLFAIISNSTTTQTAAPSWAGRLTVGAKNKTFIMGAYNGLIALGAHSWYNAQEGTGASWEDIYINPDGNKAVYIGGSPFQNKQALVKIQNVNDTTTGTVKINRSTNLTNNFKDVACWDDNVSKFNNDAGYITSSALAGYATETWVGNQGYITGITSGDVTTALGFTPYDASNPNGYTSNTGTVTSVNNVSPVGGNVTLNIPTDTNDLTNGAGYITSSALSGYLTTSDIVSSVDSSSTNSKAVGAKLFYDTCGDIETLINAL